MVSRKQFRIPDELGIRVEKDAKEKGISENDWGTMCIEHFLTCKKLEQVGGLKLIMSKFPNNCLKADCRKEINIGDYVLWGKGVGVICMDCYVKRYGDKALIAKDLKMRELRQTIKAYNKELDRLSKKVNKYQFYEKVQVLQDHAAEVQTLATKYMKQEFVDGAEKEKLDEFLALQKIQGKDIDHIHKFYEKTKLEPEDDN